MRSPIDFFSEDVCVATFGFGFGKVKIKDRDMAGDMHFDLKMLSINDTVDKVLKYYRAASRNCLFKPSSPVDTASGFLSEFTKFPFDQRRTWLQDTMENIVTELQHQQEDFENDKQ